MWRRKKGDEEFNRINRGRLPLWEPGAMYDIWAKPCAILQGAARAGAVTIPETEWRSYNRKTIQPDGSEQLDPEAEAENKVPAQQLPHKREVLDSLHNYWVGCYFEQSG